MSGSTTLKQGLPKAAPKHKDKAVNMKDHIETVLATVFGGIFVLLACVVAVETISRKVFNVSLQGADELGGYALAVGSTIAFSLALMGRNHIRVDVFHERFPRAIDRKSTRLNSSHIQKSRMPSSA